MQWNGVNLPEGTQRDWEFVAHLTPQPQGYVEIRAGAKKIFHGPAKSVVVNDDDLVEIHFHWLACNTLDDMGIPPLGGWTVAHPSANPVIFQNLFLPFVFEDTPEKGPRIRFGHSIMYLDKVPGLDPAKVAGLVLPKTTE